MGVNTVKLAELATDIGFGTAKACCACSRCWMVAGFVVSFLVYPISF